MAQVENVSGEQPEKHQGLRPLRRVPPKHAHIFHDQSANVLSEPEEPIHEPLRQSGPWASLPRFGGHGSEPFPSGKNAATAVNGGGGVVEQISGAGKRKHTKEKCMAEQDKHQEP